MIGVGLYSCSAVERSCGSERTKLDCSPLPCFLRAFGTGVISSDRRRPETGGRFSGCPLAIQSMMAGGQLIGRVQDRLVEKSGRHRMAVFLGRHWHFRLIL